MVWCEEGREAMVWCAVTVKVELQWWMSGGGRGNGEEEEESEE